MWSQLGQTILGEFNNQYLGKSVSMNSNGNIMAIGSNQYTTPENTYNYRIGKVDVYEYNSGNSTWEQLGTSIIGDKRLDFSGWSIELTDDGYRIVVGSHIDNTAGTDAGSVRVFDYDGNDWIQVGQEIEGTGAYQYTGQACSISADGSIIAVGVNNPRVFQYNSVLGIWELMGNAIAFSSGFSARLNKLGNRLIVGNPLNDAQGTDKGLCKVFQYDGSNWVQLGQDLYGEADYDNNGTSVDINYQGDIIATGAKFNDGAKSNGGHIRIYQFDGTNWVQLGQDINGTTGQWLGWTVSLSSSGYIVSSATAGPQGLHVYAYIYNSSTLSWEILGSPIVSEVLNTDSAVSLNAAGNRITIGNIFPNSSSGNVRVFEYSAPETATITVSQTITKILTDSPFSINATSNSSAAFSYYTSDASVATVDASGTVTIVGVGTTTITIQQDTISTHSGASAETTLTVLVPTDSLHFPGDGTTYLSVPAENFSIGTQDFTIEWWQYQTDSRPNPRVFSIGSWPTAKIAVSLEGGYMHFFSNSELPIAIPISGWKNNWWHFAVVRKSGVISVYINGIFKQSLGYNYDYQFNASDVLLIGNERTSSSTTSFGGQLYNFMWLIGTSKYTSNFPPSTCVPSNSNNYSLIINGEFTGGTEANNVTNMGISANSNTPPYYCPPDTNASPTAFRYSDDTYSFSYDTALLSTSYVVPTGETLTEVSVGSGVVSISDECFLGKTSLISITFSTSSALISVGNDAFSGCTGITSFTFPNSVTTLGNQLFYGCSGLTSVTLPINITSLGSGIFRECSGLTSFDVPSNITTIGNDCFRDCSELVDLDFLNARKITSIGTNCFTGTKSGIVVNYGNVKSANLLPASLSSTQGQFVSPEFRYSGALIVKASIPSLPEPLSFATTSQKESVAFIDVVPTNILNVNLESNVQETLEIVTASNEPITFTPIAKFSIRAFDESETAITDFSDNPVELAFELPDTIESYWNVYVYKLVTGTNTIMDPQPNGYPAPMVYDAITNKWKTQLLALSDVTILSQEVDLGGQKIQTIFTASTESVVKNTSEAPFNVILSTNSDGVISYSSSDTTVATVNASGQVTVVGAGTSTISISQAEGTNHLAAGPVQFTLIVRQYVSGIPTEFTYSDGTTETFTGTTVDRTSYTIPANERLIGVTFGTMVEVIGANAFNGSAIYDGDIKLNELSSIIIPANVTTLNENCFANCDNLTNVLFHNARTIVSVNSTAFSSSPSNNAPINVTFNNILNANAVGFITGLNLNANSVINYERALAKSAAVLVSGQSVTVSVDVRTSLTTVNRFDMTLNNILNTNLESNLQENLNVIQSNGDTTSAVLKFTVNAFDANDNSLTDFSEQPVTVSINLPGISTSENVYIYKINESSGAIDYNPNYPVTMSYDVNTNKWTADLPTLSTFVGMNASLGYVCFPRGSFVKTSEGNEVPIEMLNPQLHRINNKRIVAVTKTCYKDTHLVYFPENCFGNNMPLRDTRVSKSHKLLYKGEWLRALDLVGKVRNAKLVDYNGELLYNVLLEKDGVMAVNGLVCETLHPSNPVAKLACLCYNMDNTQKGNVIRWFNSQVENVFKQKKQKKSKICK